MTAAPSIRRHVRLLPELELEVMKVLWDREKATVGEVQEELKPSRPLAYTTVMTVMDRLARKEAVVRKKQGRGYLYKPAVSQEALRRLALERLLHDYFADSAQQLVEYVREKRTPIRAVSQAAPQLDSSLL